MSDKADDSKKPPMSEEERIALCQKLDEELDLFINSLERKRYTEGWPEDRWEEEMSKHPFFMKSVSPDGELSPLAEGLAQLKYDPEENTPLELATNYKEDGNFNFKHKNYRLAIMGYTEGIKVRSDDAEINASLYNNRAAANFHLENYRTALHDSERALSFNPEHTKARLRAAKSALAISKFDTCIEHCEKILQKQPKDKESLDLIDAAKKKQTLKERDQRKKYVLDTKKQVKKNAVVQAIIDRGITIDEREDGGDIDLSMLEPCIPGAETDMVRLDNGILKWPILFLYPEYQQTDFIRACPENVPIILQLEQIFPAPWDDKNTYSTKTINIYYEGTDSKPHLVNLKKNLGDILVEKYYVLKAGTPSFFCLERGSRMEKSYLEAYP
ncbi:DNA polymerase interacting tetratricopeptide repeat-containing, protein of 47 kDa [Bicyclus anynana]|uniref:DNA polymerase interacting tetratricopeptide repeat-containing, protein of 47 kDa n=1 Tax=Bicyclus anynana TaxID=110368 RepID=A0ABM3LUS2_BICAN|nr:DNA polymerase interacting tetratricopeptide repeat-containing, protein of 47 kDa [Bicyclus anynana]